MSTRNAVIVAVALLTAACGAKASGAPDIVVDRTVCSHCSMLISEPVYAAAFQTRDSDPRVFDDIGCMLDAVRSQAEVPINVWVQDAAGGGWLDAHQAIFVASPQLHTPMNGGVLAYANAAAAEKSVASYGGEVMRSFQELMILKGDAK